MTKSRRSLEELGARIGGLEEALMLNISDRGEKHKTWANYEIEKLNGRISTVAEDAKSAVDKIETVEKEIERMEATRLVEMEMAIMMVLIVVRVGWALMMTVIMMTITVREDNNKKVLLLLRQEKRSS